MKTSHRKIAVFSAALLASQACIAGVWQNNFTSVPVDSPWALAGLAAVIALISFRLLRNRKK